MPPVRRKPLPHPPRPTPIGPPREVWPPEGGITCLQGKVRPKGPGWGSGYTGPRPDIRCWRIISSAALQWRAFATCSRCCVRLSPAYAFTSTIASDLLGGSKEVRPEGGLRSGTGAPFGGMSCDAAEIERFLGQNLDRGGIQRGRFSRGTKFHRGRIS